MFKNSEISYLPRNVQSEVLIKGNVSTTYIQEIHFLEDCDLNEFKDICKDITLVNKYNLIVSDFYFKNREQILWGER
jgi:hypothetical protein